MDSDHEDRAGQVPLPGFGEPEAGYRRRRPAGTASGTRGGCRTGPWPRSSPVPGRPPWRWRTMPSPRWPPRPAPPDGGYRRPGSCQRDERAAGVSLGRDDQRVGRHRDHLHPDGEWQDRDRPHGAPGRLPRQLRTTMITTTTTSVPERPAAAPWRQVNTGDRAVAVAQREALGTTARLAVWPPEHAGAAMAAVDAVLAALDLQASRFRPDSEISWLHRSAGGLFMLSDGLAEAVRVALEAARWTGGLTDPTVGEALISLGYDRDFAAIDPNRREPPPAPSGTGLAASPARRPAAVAAGRRPARSGRHGEGPWIRPRGPGCHGRHRAHRRSTDQPGWRHRHGRDTAARRLADRRGRPARPARLGPGQRGTGPAGPAATRGGRDLVDQLPQLAPGGAGTPPHRGSAHRAARRGAVADGQRGRDHLCRCQRRRHRVDRGR